MPVSNTFSRRSLLISVALLVLVAIVIIIAVIPQVRAEYLRGGTPEMAVIAFWINVGFTVLVAVVVWFIAIRTKHRRFLPIFLLGLMSFIILILGWALSDAGGAYSGHGPEMKTASVMLFSCAVVDLIALILIIIAVIRLPKRDKVLNKNILDEGK